MGELAYKLKKSILSLDGRDALGVAAVFTLIGVKFRACLMQFGWRIEQRCLTRIICETFVTISIVQAVPIIKLTWAMVLVVKGEYDMTRYVEFYGIAADLGGKTVLDIGTSSGFFAFECARRGASVTAIDIWDGNLFNTLKEGLGLSAQYVQRSIYDLDASF